MMCAILLWSALLPGDLFILALVTAGTCAGAILPDFQMKKPKQTGLLTLAWLISRFTGLICMPALCSIYSQILPVAPDAGDKRLTHSLPGIAFILAMVTGLTLVPVLFIGYWTILSLSRFFLGGVILGMALHLLEDLCTMKGISPVFPFSSFSISGSIRPCNGADLRIARFQAEHASVLGIFLALHATGFLPVPLLQEMSVAGICVLLGCMVYTSDVTFGRSWAFPDFQRIASPVP